MVVVSEGRRALYRRSSDRRVNSLGAVQRRAASFPRAPLLRPVPPEVPVAVSPGNPSRVRPPGYVLSMLVTDELEADEDGEQEAAR